MNRMRHRKTCPKCKNRIVVINPNSEETIICNKCGLCFIGRILSKSEVGKSSWNTTTEKRNNRLLKMSEKAKVQMNNPDAKQRFIKNKTDHFSNPDKAKVTHEKIAKTMRRIFATGKHPIQSESSRKKSKDGVIEYVKTSPTKGRFETNMFAKQWFIISPRGQRFQFTNLQHFIRTNNKLFSSEQLKQACSNRDTTRAADCIRRLNPSCKRPVGNAAGWIWDHEAELAAFRNGNHSRNSTK